MAKHLTWLEGDTKQAEIIASYRLSDSQVGNTGLGFDLNASRAAIPTVKVTGLSSEEKASRELSYYRNLGKTRPDIDRNKLNFLQEIGFDEPTSIPLNGKKFEKRKDYVSKADAMENQYTKKFFDNTYETQQAIYDGLVKRADAGDKDAIYKLNLTRSAAPGYEELMLKEPEDTRSNTSKVTDFLFGGTKRSINSAALVGIGLPWWGEDINIISGQVGAWNGQLERGEISEDEWLTLYKQGLESTGVKLEDDFGTLARKIYANAAEMALDIATAGTISTGVKLGAKTAGREIIKKGSATLTKKQATREIIKQSLKTARRTAIEGGLQGAVIPFQEDDLPTLEQVGVSVAGGVAIGGALGAASVPAGKAVSKVAKKTKDALLKPVFAYFDDPKTGGFIRIPNGLSKEGSKSVNNIAADAHDFIKEQVKERAIRIQGEVDLERVTTKESVSGIKQLRKDILDLGGIAKSDVEELNSLKSIKRKAGQGADELISELNSSKGYNIIDEDDLLSRLTKETPEVPRRVKNADSRVQALKKLSEENSTEAQNFRSTVEEYQRIIDETGAEDLNIQKSFRAAESYQERQATLKEQVHKNAGMNQRTPEQKIDAAALKKKMWNQSKGSQYGYTEGKRVARQSVLERVKARDIQYNKMKRDVVDYINKNVDLDSRGKMLAAVKNAKTELDLAKAIRRADDIQEKTLQRKFRGKIANELKRARPVKNKGILRGKYTAPIHKKITSVEKITKMSRIQASQKIDTLLDALSDSSKLEKLGLEDWQAKEQIGMLSTYADIKNQSAKELGKTLDDIKYLKKFGRSKQVERDLSRRAMLEQTTKDVSMSISGGKEIDVNGFTTIKKGWVSKLDNWQQGWDTHIDKLSQFDKGSKSFDSPVSRFADSVNESRTVQNIGMRENYQAIQQAFSEIHGVSNKRTLRKILQKNTTDELVDIPTLNGRKFVELSPNKAAYMYMKWQDPTLRPRFKTMGWTQETIDELTYYMGDTNKAWADWQLNAFYPNYYKGTNAAYKNANGIDLPFNSRYSPIMTDSLDIKSPMQTLSADAKEYNSRAAIAGKGATKARTVKDLPIRPQDADQVLLRHVAQMEHYKAFDQTVRDLRAVFGRKEVRRAIEQFQGEEAMKITDEMIDAIARDGGIQAGGIEAIDILRKNFTRATLGLNPGVMIKQITSIPAYASEMPMKDFVRYTAEFWKNPRKNSKLLMDSSELLKARYNVGFTRDMIDAMSKDTVNTLSKNEGFLNKMMITTKLGDRGAILQGGYANYKWNYKNFIKDGLSPADAHKKAIKAFERVTNRTQQAGQIEHMGKLQRGNKLAKLFTMFQTAPNQYYRIASRSMRDLKNGKGSKAQNLKNLYITWSLLPGLFQMVSDGGIDPQTQTKAQILGPLNGILMVGQVIDPAIAAITGNDTFDKQGIPGPIANFDDAVKAIEQVNKTITADDISSSDLADLLDNLLDVGGKFTGLPTVSTTRAVEGVDSVVREEAKSGRSTFDVSQTPENYLRAIIYGKYGTVEGSKFADENFGRNKSTKKKSSRPRSGRKINKRRR